METDKKDKIIDTGEILNFIKSKKIAVVVTVLFSFALLAGTFSVGVAVGYMKAKFSYAWGENYHRNFGGPRGGFMGNFDQDLEGRDFIGAHGTFGQIISIGGSELVVRGKDNVEKIIVVNTNTDIRFFKNTIQLKDLSVDEFITVIGEPNNSGQIEAKFIRVLPSPSAMPSMMNRL